jgi:signal transduction histidine kinase
MTARELATARRRELGLAALRWLVVAFGAFQTSLAIRGQGEPEYVLPMAFALMLGLAIGNVAITSAALRARELSHLGAIGAAAFVLDTAVVLGLLWSSTASPSDPQWVIGYLVALEGAARYGLTGALVGATLFTGSEVLREHYLPERFTGYVFDGSGLAYRVGMGFAVAIVSGAFARSLRRETRRANERAEAAESLARSEAAARTQLEELDVMKTDFIAITSHELRTPLASIRGFVDTLRRRRHLLRDEEIQEFLAIIQVQADRLSRLVEDLLVVSRLEAGVLTLQPDRTLLASLLSNAVRGLGDTASRIDVREEPELPDEIEVDEQRLTQVLTNLLTNAVKFSPPVARIVLRVGPAARDSVSFAVTDKGPGIPPDEVERIFDRFHQVGSATNRPAEGAGLGLYITKQLVEMMGGVITVASVVGEGSTFRVTIPAAPADSPAPARPFGAAMSG